MRLALVTCGNLPEWEKDDRPLATALAEKVEHVVEPRWDDPRFDWASCDAALVRTTWDYMPKATAFAAWIDRAGGLTRLFNPPDVLRWSLDKRYLRELERRGVPLAPTEWLEPETEIDVAALVRARGWSTAFLKPVIGASAVDTLRFAADQEGLAAAARHVRTTAAPAGFMLQPYLRRVETDGETSLVFVDGEFTHGVRKVPISGDYRVQDDYGASDGPHAPAADELEVAMGALAAVPFAGPLLYARVDLLRDDEGRPVLVELELIEPSLFFRHAPEAAGRLADAFVARARR